MFDCLYTKKKSMFSILDGRHLKLNSINFDPISFTFVFTSIYIQTVKIKLILV